MFAVEKNILEIKNLQKTYQTKEKEIKAIENFNLELKEGEFISIVGPSGCGKSTILSILSGIDKDYKGSINIKDNVKFGYMLQQDALLDWKNVFENCMIGLDIQKKRNKENINYVQNLLESYGLKEFMTSYPKNLSGGMRQRVALIRTLATKPDIILLDEPFSALDYQSRLDVSNDVYRILKNEHKSAIIVTHDIAEAVTLSDKVIILSKRPSIVKKIIKINWDKNILPIERRKEPIFNHYYEMIWKEIDHNA